MIQNIESNYSRKRNLARKQTSIPAGAGHPLSGQRRYIILACMLFAQLAHTQDDTNAVDLVSFYKQAITSPPEVESFVARQQTLRSISQREPFHTNIFQYFWGARSATNYFLSAAGTNDTANLRQSGAITGRSGDSRYAVGGQIVSRSVGTNSVAAVTDALYSLLRQFLDMGANDIDPSTVIWDHDTFIAKNMRGLEVIGSLETSNNLPAHLEIRLGTNSSPYKAITYTYPNPPAKLSGFPASFVVSTKAGAAMKPVVEVNIIRMQLAKRHLPQSFFSDYAFKDIVKYTNLYSNSDLYVFNTKKNQLVMANSFLTSGGTTNSRSHAIVYALLMLPTIAMVILYAFQKKSQTNKSK